MKSFIDEDWTGLTYQQIWSQIEAELEEEQCKKEGHRWYPVFVCSTCGESFELDTFCRSRNKNRKEE